MMKYEDVVFKFQPQSREEAYSLGLAVGFQKAIEMLSVPDRERFNAGVTNCMHSVEWAKWLEANKEEALK